MPPVKSASVDEMLATFAGSKVSVPVYVSVPVARPAEFLRVRRVGGGAVNRVLDEPIVAVEGWAASSARAEEIALAFRDVLVNEYTDMPLVRSVEIINGPVFDPDPDSKTPRYSFSAVMRVRGSRS